MEIKSQVVIVFSSHSLPRYSWRSRRISREPQLQLFVPGW